MPWQAQSERHNIGCMVCVKSLRSMLAHPAECLSAHDLHYLYGYSSNDQVKMNEPCRPCSICFVKRGKRGKRHAHANVLTQKPVQLARGKRKGQHRRRVCREAHFPASAENALRL